MPLPARYRCCRKSLPVTEDFLSLLESAAGQNPPVFPCQTEGQCRISEGHGFIYGVCFYQILYMLPAMGFS